MEAKAVQAALEIKKLQHIIKELTNNSIPQTTDNCDPNTCKHAIELEKFRARLTYYENAFSPSSANSIPTMQRKASTQKDPETYKTSGRPKDHPGVSQTRKSVETIFYKDEECPNCFKTNITYDNHYQCRISDIKEIPVVETKTHVGYMHHCKDCGHEWDSTEQIPKIEGTEIGPNLAAHIGICLANNQTQGMIKEQLKSFKFNVSKATINNFVNPFASALRKDVEKMCESANTIFVKFDETTSRVPGQKRGYVWLCVTDDHVLQNLKTNQKRLTDIVHIP